MPRVIVAPSALNPTLRTVHTFQGDVGAFVRERYPNVKRWSFQTDGVDHYAVGVPADPVTAFIAAINWYAVAASIALSFVAGKLLAKKPPAGVTRSTDAASPTYSIGSLQNQARLGAVIPVVYGEVTMLPDYATQPVVEFINDEQYLKAIYCVGHGDVDVTRVFAGETDVDALGVAVVKWQSFKPADHHSTFGTIESASGVYENVFTNTEVADQVLLAGKPIGPFEMCKPNQTGDEAMLDIVLPGGLYSQNTTTGAMLPNTVTVKFTFFPIDANGASTGAAIEHQHNFTNTTVNAIRETLKFTLPAGRYRCSAERTSPDRNLSYVMDTMNWVGLKLKLTAPAHPVYGDVTLVALTLKATNGVSNESSGKVRMRCRRNLTAVDGAVRFTANPVDVMVDMLTAKYGGRRPNTDEELDKAELLRSHTKWTTHNGFNAVFDRMTTVWDAMASALQVVAAVPLPQGNRMSIAHDSVKDFRAALFTDDNIVAGSLQVGYEFDKIGDPEATKVEYRTQEWFDPDFVLLPPNRDDFESVNLFGCTDKTVAEQHAHLTNNRRRLRRKTVQFETELDGALVFHGQRIGIAHSTPKWGQSAQVVERNGNTLTMNAVIDWSVPNLTMLIRDVEGYPHQVRGITQGATPKHVILPADPTFVIPTIDGGYEGAVAAFGEANHEVKDWIVLSMEPVSEFRIRISAAEYRPDVYVSAMPHQLIDSTVNP